MEFSPAKTSYITKPSLVRLSGVSRDGFLLSLYLGDDDGVAVFLEEADEVIRLHPDRGPVVVGMDGDLVSHKVFVEDDDDRLCFVVQGA